MARYSLMYVVLLVLLPACASEPKSPEEPAGLQRIYCHRTGGLAGVDERVEIQPDGRYGVSRRGEPPHEGKLTRDQIALLAGQFRTFGTLRGDYPPPPRMVDDFRYELTYGDRRVTASDANPHVPQRLRDLWGAVEAIAIQQR
jgi:hypothetical protein